MGDQGRTFSFSFLLKRVKEFEIAISRLLPVHIIQQFYSYNFTNYKKIYDKQLNISKKKFWNLSKQLPYVNLMLNQSFVCNLTNVKLPDFVLSTLSLGDKFNFPLNNNKDIPAFEIIK